MWSIKSDECMELYQEDEKIAALIWDEVEMCWGLWYRMSLFQRLSCIGEMEGFGKLDIEPVQMAAVETIIDYCKRQADKWEGRAEDMEEMI